MSKYGGVVSKCVCGRSVAKDFVCCRVCYEKLPDHLRMALRFRAGREMHTNRQAYKQVQKAARQFLEAR